MLKKLAFVASLSLTFAAASTANAAPPTLTPVDLTPNVSGPFCSASVFVPAYVSCIGSYSGNNTGNAQTLLNVRTELTQNWGGIWTEVGTTDAGDNNSPFSDVPGGSSGTLKLTTARSGIFALALKSSTDYSIFLFNLTGSAVQNFQFTTNGVSVNGSNIAQGLSHASLYTGTDGPNGLCITGPGRSCLTNVVPEPSTYALMTAGLLGIFGVARRRRNNAKV